jgi:hypothetical protein
MLDRTKDPLDEVAPGFVTPLRALVVAATLAGAVLLSACGGSSSSSSSSTQSSSTSSSTSSQSSPTTSSPGSALTGDAATIRDVYLRFLDLTVPVDQKIDLIQDGTEFKDAMVAEAKNPAAKGIGLQVSDVKVVSPKLADVTFTILVSGSPLLPDQHGYAVNEDGKWKIAGVTFCGLLAAQGPTNVPPVCSTPAATALPTG